MVPLVDRAHARARRLDGAGRRLVTAVAIQVRRLEHVRAQPSLPSTRPRVYHGVEDRHFNFNGTQGNLSARPVLSPS